MSSTDAAFSGSIPALYDRCLGPLLFEPYALDMAARLASLRPRRILETAAGTGIVTAALARALPDAEIVATDLNQAMLDVAAERISAPKVSFTAADAQALPFPDGSFDAVVCQFGAMFFPDRVGAYREALRMLKPDGFFVFNCWDRIDRNPVSEVVASAVADLFPDDPPSFLSRVPFGYADTSQVERDLRAAGFGDISFETIALESRMASPRDAATGLCQGSPLRSEIEQRAASLLEEATAAAATELECRGYGAGAESPLSAHIFTAAR